MGRRGHSTAIGKFAKMHHDRRVSDIRRFGEMLHAESHGPAESRTKAEQAPTRPPR